jgi:hypothetical protein
MAMSDVEKEFESDVEEMDDAVTSALEELSRVKAYTLTVEELRDFKAAHYALRNLATDYYDEDIPPLYQTRIEVRADKRRDADN